MRSLYFVTLAIAASSRVTHGEDLELASVRERIRILHESLDSLHITVQESPFLIKGEPGTIELDLWLAAPSSRALKISYIHADSSRRLSDELRADGRLTHTFVRPDQSLGLPDLYLAENQSTEHDDLSKYLNRALWLFTPGGRSLHEHLEGGAILEWGSGDGGVAPLLLKSSHKGMPIECRLDPAHDFLPASVVLTAKSGVIRMSATGFGLADGRWFPLEGEEAVESRDGGEPEKWTFKVKLAEFNRPFDHAAVFGPFRAIPDGTLVDDRINGKKFIQGGEAAARSIASKLASRAEPRSEPVSASRAETKLNWRWIAWGTAVAALGAAALTFRMSRRPSA